jgi:hypothetical protein
VRISVSNVAGTAAPPSSTTSNCFSHASPSDLEPGKLRRHERDDLRPVLGQADGRQGVLLAEASVDDGMTSAGEARADGGHEAADMPRRRARDAVEHGGESAGDERVAQRDDGGAEGLRGVDDEFHLPAGAAGRDHHAAAPVQRPVARAESARFEGGPEDRRAAGKLTRGFFALGAGPLRIAQEDRQPRVMRPQGFAQMLRVVRVEDRDGAHVSSCQKPAQS